MVVWDEVEGDVCWQHMQIDGGHVRERWWGDGGDIDRRGLRRVWCSSSEGDGPAGRKRESKSG